MTYLSLSWLGWMWATTALYWIAPRDLRLPLLATITLGFLSIYSPLSAILLTGSTLLVHLVTRGERVRGLFVGLAIAALVIVLFSFKVGQRIDDSALIDTVLIPLGVAEDGQAARGRRHVGR